MGMFDTIFCEVPLPDRWLAPKDEDFQSKDLECELLEHRIKRDGTFHRTVEDRSQPRCLRDVGIDHSFNEELNFYSDETLAEEFQVGLTWNARRSIWHEYNAFFENGKLDRIELYIGSTKENLMTVRSQMDPNGRNSREGRYAGKGKRRSRDFKKQIGVKHEHRWVVVRNIEKEEKWKQ
jgi:hypothetical protein